MPVAVAPYAQINTLKAVADQLWIVDGPLIPLGYAGAGLPFPTGMTVIRLEAGTLWMHSPTEPTPGLRAKVDALGPVSHLIAPKQAALLVDRRMEGGLSGGARLRGARRAHAGGKAQDHVRPGPGRKVA